MLCLADILKGRSRASRAIVTLEARAFWVCEASSAAILTCQTRDALGLASSSFVRKVEASETRIRQTSGLRAVVALRARAVVTL